MWSQDLQTEHKMLVNKLEYKLKLVRNLKETEIERKDFGC